MGIKTTVTLDEDIFERLQVMSADCGAGFEDVLNEVLRVGLSNSALRAKGEPYVIKPLSLGVPLVENMDNIGRLLDEIEGEDRRF